MEETQVQQERWQRCAWSGAPRPHAPARIAPMGNGHGWGEGFLGCRLCECPLVLEAGCSGFAPAVMDSIAAAGRPWVPSPVRARRAVFTLMNAFGRPSQVIDVNLCPA